MKGNNININLNEIIGRKKKINLNEMTKSRKKIIFKIIFSISIFFCIFLVRFSFYSIITNLNGVFIGIFSGVLIFYVNLIITRGLRSMKLYYFKPKSDNFMNSLFFSNYSNILLIVLGATIEELISRDYLLSLTNMYFDIYISIGINAIIFYIMHLNKKIIQLILMSILFSIITIYTNSILPAIIGHLINNLLVYFYKRKAISI